MYALFASSAFAQHANSRAVHILEGKAQGTTYSIRYYADKEICEESVDSIFRVIDGSMSLYLSHSLIAKFNNAEVLAIDMDNHMKSVVQKSFEINRLSAGYFDITIFPLMQLWGFGPAGFKRNPAASEIESVMAYTGMNKLKMTGNRLVKKDKRVAIDLNGIAQGYTVDVLGRYLEKQGVQNYMVELGGEIKVRGEKPDGNFQIAIQRPPDPTLVKTRGDALILKLKNKSVTTSGSYDKRRILNETFISHHIDPRVGTPIQRKTVSVTVIANTTMEADGWDNFFMFLEPEEAIRFANKMKGVELYVIYYEDNMLKEAFSKGFKNYINN